MLALGLILILLAVALLIAVLAAGPSDPVTFNLGAFSVETNALVVFLLGAGTLLVFVFGLELLRSGAKRARQRRKEHKEVNRLTKEREQQQVAAREPEREPARETARDSRTTTGATTTDEDGRHRGEPGEGSPEHRTPTS